MSNLVFGIRLQADGAGFSGTVKIAKKEIDNLSRSTRGLSGSMDQGKKKTFSFTQAMTGGTKAARKLAAAEEKAAKKAERLARSQGKVTKQMGFLRSAIGAVGVALLTRQFVALSDTSINVRARLANVTEGTSELVDIQKKLFEQAQETRLSFESTVVLYSRLARSSENLNFSQKQVLELNRLVNQSIKISGATSQEAAAGVIQFGQAMASGVLRGDELRSVSEQMTRLAQAISDGLGISLGTLRTLGNEGKLTAEKVANALISQKEIIEREFSKLPRSVGDALSNLRNELIRVVDDENKALGATKALTGGIDLLRNNLGPVISGLTAATVGFVAYRAAVILGTLATTRFTAALLLNPVTAVAVGVGVLAAGLILLANRNDELTVAEERHAAILEKVNELTREAAVLSGKRKDAVKEERDALIGLSLADLQKKRQELNERLEGAKSRLRKAAGRPGITAGFKESNEAAQIQAELLVVEKRIADLTKVSENLANTFDLIPISMRKATAALTPFQLKLQELLDRFDPLAAKEREFREQVDLLSEAMVGGLITTERYKEIIIQLTEQAFPSFNKFFEESRAAIEEEIRLLGLSARERAIELATRRLVNDAQKSGIEVTQQEIAQLRDLAIAQVNAGLAAAARAEVEKKAQTEIARIRQNAIENTQRALADTFESLLDGQIRGVKDFWNAFTSIGKRAIAETLAANVFKNASSGGFFDAIFGGFGAQGSSEGDDGQKNKTEASVDRFTSAIDKFGSSVGLEKLSEKLADAGKGFIVASIASSILGGGQTGGAIGGAIGSFLPIPGGNIVGAIAGSILGKVFGKTPRSSVPILAGASGVDLGSAFKRGKGDVGAATSLGQSAADAFNAIANLTGAIFSGNLGSLGFRKDVPFFDPTGGTGKKKDRITFGSSDEALLFAVKRALSGGNVSGLSDTFRTISRSSKSGNVQGLLNDLEFGKIFDELVNVKTGITGAEEAIISLNRAYGDASKRARQLGLSEVKLAEARQKQIDALKKDFNTDIRLQILDITSPLEAELERLKIIGEQRLREAVALGADLVEVERLNALDREEILNRFRSNSGNIFSAVASDIEDFINDLKSGPGSALSRGQVLENAQSRFSDLIAAAREGDVTAQTQVVDAARNLREASQAIFGSTAAAFERENFIVATLESLKLQTGETLDVDAIAAKVPVPFLSEDILKEIGSNIAEGNADVTDLLTSINDNLDRLNDNFDSPSVVPIRGGRGGGGGSENGDFAEGGTFRSAAF